MLYLACYDLDDDRLRLKVANRLLAYGLERIQRSVFVGPLEAPRRQALLDEVRTLISQSRAVETAFLLMPLAEAHARQADWLGECPPDWDYHTNQQHTLIV